jgi:hypothetical protein
VAEARAWWSGSESLCDPWEHGEEVRASLSRPRFLAPWAATLAAWLAAVLPMLQLRGQGATSPADAAMGSAALLFGLVVTGRTTERSAGRWALALLAAGAAMQTVDPSVRPLFGYSLVASFVAARSLEPPARRWGVSTAGPSVVGASFGTVVGASLAVARGAHAAVPTALLALGGALLLLDRWRPQISAGLHAKVMAVSVRTVEGVGAVVLFLTVLVTMYLPGLLGRAANWAQRRRPRETYWVDRARSAGDAPGDARRPFVKASGSSRLRRAIGAMVVIPLLAGVTYWNARPDPGPERTDVPRVEVPTPDAQEALERGQAALSGIEATPYSSRPAFRGVPFADDMQRELGGYQFVDDALTGYGGGNFTGRYTNVVDGSRRTLSPSCAGCPTVDVWLIGGSTVFGLGQRDEHTIASELVRIGDRAGLAVRVRNLGLPGWTVRQSALDLERRLAAADAPPDLVVSLDGFNDVAAALFDRAFERPDSTTPALRADDSMLFLGGAGRSLDTHASREAGALAARRHSAERDRLTEVLAPAGIDSRYFFQPDAFGTPVQSGYLDDYYEDAPALLDRLDLPAALDEASRRLAPGSFSLRDVFEDHDRPVFADLVHVNEEGAAIIAAAMWSQLEAELVRLAG